MFYTKKTLPNGRTIKTELTDENVFTRCPVCDCELSVDLQELFADGETDLCGTAIYCSACSKNYEAFAYVPDDARDGLTDAELDKALCGLGLSPEEECAVREVCKKGYAIAPELRRSKGCNYEVTP
jgi:hypothetical protein